MIAVWLETHRSGAAAKSMVGVPGKMPSVALPPIPPTPADFSALFQATSEPVPEPAREPAREPAGEPVREPVPLAQRLKALDQELAEIKGSLRQLKKQPPQLATPSQPRSRFGSGVTGAAPKTPLPTPPIPAARPAVLRRQRDERFTDYLASSLGPPEPLSHERRVQRNKAIMAVGVAVTLLFWLFHRLAS